MQPSGQQPVWGNSGYPVVTPAPTIQNSSDGKLWGSTVRRAMGIVQISCGVIEFALGIVLVCLPLKYFYHDAVAWGIWNGVFAVITGFFGVYSKRSKCMVIAYMVLSIIAAVMSGGCCISTTSVTPQLQSIRHYYPSDYRYGSYDYGFYYGRNYYDRNNGYTYATAHFAIYIILDVVFALQMLMSILGASFTCGALYSRDNQQRMVYQLNGQAPNQPFGPAPPYTAVATQAQPYNTGYNSHPFHQPGPVVIATTGYPTTGYPTTGYPTTGYPTTAVGTTGIGPNTMGAVASSKT